MSDLSIILKKVVIVLLFSIFLFSNLKGQQTNQQSNIALNDLSFFNKSGANWTIAGDVTSDPYKPKVLNVKPGTGILLSLPGKGKQSADLLTTALYGDMDVEVDFMVSKGAASKIYLQGRYGISLQDSWGNIGVTPAANGGFVPRQNVAKAPGLWQRLKISFQAAKFDGSGQKTADAKMLFVELNGILIHENITLKGPDKDALENNEVALGPLRFHADDAVAFRNLVIKNYNNLSPQFKDLKYSIYKGKFDRDTNLLKLQAVEKGSSASLIFNLRPLDNEYLIHYHGMLNITVPGVYGFNMNPLGNGGIIKINGKAIADWNNSAAVELQAGAIPVDILYSKLVGWVKPGLSIVISGPGIRPYEATDLNSFAGNDVDPIFINASENKVVRSFMKLPGGKLLTHSVSVGTPDNIHYTYDLDCGAIAQIWRGSFLDATPMWHDRGDGTAKPTGAVQSFGNPELVFSRLASLEADWPADTVGSNYKPSGYVIDESDLPAFNYQVYGAKVTDEIRNLNYKEGIRRVLTIDQIPEHLYIKLAEGSDITEVSDKKYLVADKSYYLFIEEGGNAKPVIRTIKGHKELIMPLNAQKIIYTILF